MNYLKLKRPIYWVGYVDGEFKQYTFTKYQEKYPSYIATEKQDIIRRVEERKFDIINTVGCYSCYSYNEFDMDKFKNYVIKMEKERVEMLKKKYLDAKNKLDKLINN